MVLYVCYVRTRPYERMQDFSATQQARDLHSCRPPRIPPLVGQKFFHEKDDGWAKVAMKASLLCPHSASVCDVMGHRRHPHNIPRRRSSAKQSSLIRICLPSTSTTHRGATTSVTTRNSCTGLALAPRAGWYPRRTPTRCHVPACTFPYPRGQPGTDKEPEAILFRVSRHVLLSVGEK